MTEQELKIRDLKGKENVVANYVQDFKKEKYEMNWNKLKRK